MGTAQAILLPQNLQDIIRVKNPMDRDIEVVFQSGTQYVELAAIAAQNVRGEEDIMSIAPIPAYLVYNVFNQDISVVLFCKSLCDSQHSSPMQDHAVFFLRS